MQPMLADLARALDPASIATDVGLTLDPWQSALMRSTSPRVLLLASRQSGKSTAVALIAAHVATSEPGALILVVSPTQNQSKELFRTIMGFLRKLGAEFKSDSVLRCEMRNGARIIALPGESDTVRGYSAPSLILLDEAARITDDLFTSVTPMTATRPDARVIALSTPKNRRGWWAEAFLSDDPMWQRIRVPVELCPRITPEFLAQERRSLGELAFSEEYMLSFHDGDDQVFSTEAVDAAFALGAGIGGLWS